MNRNDLRNVDLGLLVIFETLLREGSATKTAEKLGVGQPTISAALVRLRNLYGDPLFFRSGRGMEPTQHALKVAQHIGPALDSVYKAVTPVQAFEPAKTDKEFHLGLSHDVEFALLPGLIKHVRQDAPGVTLVAHRAGDSDLAQMLNSGKISVGVGYRQDLPDNLREFVLRSCRVVLLRRDDEHRQITLDEFCSRPHALISDLGRSFDGVDRALDRLQRRRQVALTLTQFNGLESLIEDSNLLAVVPDFVAPTLLASLRLHADRVPLKLERVDLIMMWRTAHEHDVAEAWLRSKVREYFDRQLSGDQHDDVPRLSLALNHDDHHY